MEFHRLKHEKQSVKGSELDVNVVAYVRHICGMHASTCPRSTLNKGSVMYVQRLIIEYSDRLRNDKQAVALWSRRYGRLVLSYMRFAMSSFVDTSEHQRQLWRPKEAVY